MEQHLLIRKARGNDPVFEGNQYIVLHTIPSIHMRESVVVSANILYKAVEGAIAVAEAHRQAYPISTISVDSTNIGNGELQELHRRNLHPRIQ